jgi:uncharacterized repeat protein (TIGR04076 family)
MAKIKVTVEKIDGYCNNAMLVGDYFYVENSKLTIPEGKHICTWALQSMMPVFPIMNEHKNLDAKHWIKATNQFVCPDPKGKVHFKIEIDD